MSKIKYIHDYICLSTEYDYPSYESGNVGGKLQTAYSCAVEYKTVCAGYSTLFQYYMQNLGIPCAYVCGHGHAWNFLKVNDQYYQMDVTWNDTKQIPPYYNLTNEEMQKVESHTPESLSKKIIDTHPSTGNQMSYLQYFGALSEGSPYTYQELNYYDYEKNSSTQQPLMIYKNEPEILSIVKNVETIVPPKIGDKGPGGGIVFYIEENKAYECSELLGDTNWKIQKPCVKSTKVVENQTDFRFLPAFSKARL